MVVAEFANKEAIKRDLERRLIPVYLTPDREKFQMGFLTRHLFMVGFTKNHLIDGKNSSLICKKTGSETTVCPCGT
ncbi:MAG: hypothetical protein COT73_13245 [Bdellovibrio sp. CG10_big_fil_rev_8_21_14_0_10_47_8]|nr:MAG: hypothetical protein COT73_13245 [Bdellovibrio sp. CG10_big_fil_rev_8_21_14_0_10_47_8]